MKHKNLNFKIKRYQPGLIDPPQFHEFQIEINEKMTVLDAVEKIYSLKDSTLVYRHSCHHSSCGTCAAVINGKESLMCITNVYSLNTEVVTIEPLKNHDIIADLAVHMKNFYHDFDVNWDYLKKSETKQNPQLPPNFPIFERLQNCIECASCVSACPEMKDQNIFFGPAVLSAINNQRKEHPDQSQDLLKRAKGEQGEKLCQRHIACSKVCPSKVFPARQIMELRKL
ncbi:MAG: 2Fe-2S iron-sulfur cluster-binding protein [Spirochaetes bacterium]|nr:2Fe-2S iron-sulfur cluster-binding protein [Spirochaetota bacterium]